MMDRIVPSMDAEVSNALRTALEKKGITIMTSTKLQEIVETDGKLTVKLR
ncbi:dihydrolipoamide dehydrogenase [Streptobacillus moniliformis]|nr:dihydrolipoamide dehydrogenase [Streptobacillus moniliformis]